MIDACRVEEIHMIADRILDVKNLSFSYPEFDLKNISFPISRGEIVGLIGPNGAGKTTTIRCITGQSLPREGDSTILDCSLRKNPHRYKSMMAYVCEETSIYDSLSPVQFVSIFRPFYPHWDEERYRALSLRFDVDEKKKLSNFSKGMKMKFHLAFALSHQAKVLILDEPTSGLDPFVRSDFLKIITDEAKNGIAVLFSTHITEDVLKAASRVIFISEGEIRFDLPTQEIDRSCFRVKREDYHHVHAYPHKLIARIGSQYYLWLDKPTFTDGLPMDSALFYPVKFDEMMLEVNRGSE